jgi:hypothetical protein
MEDIETVYFFRRGNGNSPSDSLLFDKGTERIALFFCELLTVVKRGVAKIRRQDDGSGKDVSCKTSSSGFVATGFHTVYVQTREKHQSGSGGRWR